MKTTIKIISVSLLLLVNYKSNAQIIWQKCLGGSQADEAHFVQITADGGYILAGQSISNNGDVSGNHGGWDYWIVKLDSFRNIQWQKSLGGTLGELTYAIQQTNDGSYIVAGSSSSNDGDVSGNHGDTDYWIVKLDFAGNIQWQKTYGGTAPDYAHSIQLTTDGGYIVAGYTESNDGDVSGNHGSADYWILKLDSTGNIQWQKTYGGTQVDYALSIKQTYDEGFIVAGVSYSNNGNVSGNHGDKDSWIVKIDSIGDIEWQKSYGGTFDDITVSIQITNDGGYIVAGSSTSNNEDVSGNHGFDDYWILKIDSLGFIQWQKSLGGSSYDNANSIQQTKDGGYIVTGSSFSNNGDVTGNHGDSDSWIVKLDSIGFIQWQNSFGGTGRDIGNSIHQTDDGDYIVAGHSDSNNGDVSGNHGSADYWILKLDSFLITRIDELNNKEEYRFYPNPTTNQIQIELQNTTHKIESVAMYDVTGKAVLSAPCAVPCVADVSHLPNGLYFLNIEMINGQRVVRKVVKE